MATPPHPFAPSTYVAWHEEQFPDDAPLVVKVEDARRDLITNSRPQLIALEQVLAYTRNYCRNEYQHAKNDTTEYVVSLSLAVEQGGTAYDQLFKSAASIINKLWRKNGSGGSVVHLGNLREHITDLVRTDIVASTLDSAAFLAQRLNGLPGIIYEPKARKAYESHIHSVQFMPEMKMGSGYFAYHGLVRFKDGLFVEVQIYSELMSHWRKLSHLLYDRARIAPIQQHEFDSKESRLVSLGHMLHLAECQLRQLAAEFGDM